MGVDLNTLTERDSDRGSVQLDQHKPERLPVFPMTRNRHGFGLRPISVESGFFADQKAFWISVDWQASRFWLLLFQRLEAVKPKTCHVVPSGRKNYMLCRADGERERSCATVDTSLLVTRLACSSSCLCCPVPGKDVCVEQPLDC